MGACLVSSSCESSCLMSFSPWSLPVLRAAPSVSTAVVYQQERNKNARFEVSERVLAERRRDAPGGKGVPAVEHLLHLLESTSLGLREHEELRKTRKAVATRLSRLRCKRKPERTMWMAAAMLKAM